MIPQYNKIKEEIKKNNLYLKAKATLGVGRSFNDVIASGENSIYAINGAYGTQNLSGFPTDAYPYGVLLTLNPSLIVGSSSAWNICQIYIPDIPSQSGVFFRTRTAASWVKLTGTAINPVT